MIIINENKYSIFDYKVSWGKFHVTNNGKRRDGKAPFITFNIDNNKYIGLEFTFSDDMFKQMKVNVKTNLKEYISDILYDDEKGWISIIDGNYEIYLTGLSEKEFNINFCIKAHDVDEEFNIFLDENISIL